MKCYKDGKDAIWFPGDYVLPEDFYDLKKERRILRNIVNACYHEGLDPFSTIMAFCVSDVADMICKKSHVGYFYSEGRFMCDLENYGFLKKLSKEWDVIRFHWVVDVYVTARELGLTYFEIGSQYPAERVYDAFNPLHETSELNALGKMKFDRVELCGCIINDKYYLYKDDVPKDKRYLLDKSDQAESRRGIIYMNTVFFHRANEPNGYLSNWYPSEFKLDNQTFSCVEQYMMWRKAKLFKDEDTAELILKESNPASIKKLGRSVVGYVDSVWAAKRYSVVRDAVLAKFSQNDELRKKFLDESGLFAECAANDCIWGIGLSIDDPDRIDRCRWRGQNLLGRALEEVYKELKHCS